MTIEHKPTSVPRPSILYFVAAATVLLTLPLRAADVTNIQQVGNFLAAYLEFPGPSTESKVIIYINGNFGKSKQTGDPASVLSKVEVTYILYDGLSGTYPIIANGSAQFPGGSGLHIKPSLIGASVDASLVIKDQTQTLPVVVNAGFTGVGDAFKEHIVNHFVGPNVVINGRHIGSFRFAMPSGTVTIGTTTYDLGQASFSDIYFGTANSGFILISKN